MRVDRKAMCEWFLKTIGMNLLIHECPAEPMGDKHVHEFSLIFYDGGSILNLMYYIIKKAANNGKPLKRVRITPHRYFKECMNYLSDEWFESETVENDFLVTATIVMNFKAGFSDESNRLHMIDFITGYKLHSEIWEFEINQAEPVVHALEQFSHRLECIYEKKAGTGLSDSCQLERLGVNDSWGLPEASLIK